MPVRLLLRDRFAAIDQIRRIRAPLPVIAGAHDRIVPIENSRRLYEAAVAPRTLLVLPDADHNDDALLAGTSSPPETGERVPGVRAKRLSWIIRGERHRRTIA